MTMSTFVVACLQLALPPEGDQDLIEREIRAVKARMPQVGMVVLPELCTFGVGLAHAQPMPGDVEDRYRSIARDLGIWLAPGSMLERNGGAVHNTAPVIDPAGEVVGRYRKMYPWLPYERSVTPGDDFLVFDVPEVGRFGVSICYDMWFPETVRTLVWLGAEVIIHPTLTNTIDRDSECAIARANATMNQCYFLDVNAAGDLGLGRACTARAAR